MKSLKSYISKKVVSINEGKEVGYVLDGSFDESLSRLLGLIVVDSESEEERLLPAKKIKAENDQIIFIEDESDIEFCEKNDRLNPIGKSVFDSKGVSFGRVEDCLLKDSFAVEKLVTDRCEIMQKNIITNGKDFLFFGLKKKNNKKNNVFFENYQKNTEIIQNNFPKIKIQEKINLNNISKPERIYSSTKMLLNKIATCDVYGYNNELIVKKNETVDENVVKKAKKHNKLNFLLFNCK